MTPALDPLLLEPKRLQICGSLLAVDEAEFAVVRDALGVADSVLSKHLKTLEQAGYVVSRKRTGTSARPRTWISLTRGGRAAVRAHVGELQRLAALAATEPPRTSEPSGRSGPAQPSSRPR